MIPGFSIPRKKDGTDMKFLHAADLHLDSPFSGTSLEKAEVRRSELRGAFTSLMLYAKTEAELVLLPGDLFDSEHVTKDTADLMKKEFAALPDVKFVIAPGNHDPFSDGSVWARTKFSDNVYIFDPKGPGVFRFDDLNCDVYGFGYRENAAAFPFPEDFVPDAPSRINILCAHLDLTASSPYAGTTPERLAACGFDYCALGHIHNGTGILKSGNTFYGYPGCLEGRDYGETGPKGVIAGEMKKSGGVFRLDWKGIRFSKRRYEVAAMNVTGVENETALGEAVRSAVIAGKYGSDTLLRLTLEGEVRPELRVSEQALRDAAGDLVFQLDIADKTLPIFDTDALKQDFSIRGAFFRRLEPMLRSEDEKERKIAAMALRVGLAAIDNGEIGFGL